MMVNLRLPIAISNSTNELVNAKDVPNGLDCNCSCAMCGERLIAVNKEIKQRAHFRHKKDSLCELNGKYESYIHWLTKEVFKTINTISLPAIYSNHLRFEDRKSVHERASIQVEFDNDQGKKAITFDEIDDFVVYNPRNLLLQKISTIEIQSCKIEKTYQSRHGEIRVDIVASSYGSDLFIEPYYLNKIDDNKLLKISNINTSTISINLLNFVDKHKFLFTVEEFKQFLMNDIRSKEWVFIRDSKVKSLIESFFKKAWPSQQQEIKRIIKNNRLLEDKILNNNTMIDQLMQENAKLQSRIKEIDIDDSFN